MMVYGAHSFACACTHKPLRNTPDAQEKELEKKDKPDLCGEDLMHFAKVLKASHAAAVSEWEASVAASEAAAK